MSQQQMVSGGMICLVVGVFKEGHCKLYFSSWTTSKENGSIRAPQNSE